MPSIQTENKIFSGQDESIDLKKIFSTLFDKWHWFLMSVIIFVIAAFMYTRYTAPIFQINAKLLVNDDEKGGGLGKQAGSLMDLGGILGSRNSVENEVEILKTRFLMEQVVRQMQLNITYSRKINLVSRELYQAPFRIVIEKGVDTILATRLDIDIKPQGKLRITSDHFEKDVTFNEIFDLKGVGKVKVTPGSDGVMPIGEFFVTIKSIDQRVAELMRQLSVGVSNKQVTIIDLGLAYPLPNKGEDILNTIITQYTNTNLSDKNSIADSTYKFIKERLNVIAAELGDVEDNVESFKKSNKLADMSEQGKLLVQNTGEFSSELAKAETQISILTDLEKYLKDETKNKRVFPTSLLPSDMVFSNMMGNYNSLLIERDRLLLGNTEESPFVKNIDNQIASMRQGILANIESTKNTFVLTRSKLRGQLASAENQISDVPQIEKNYLKLARNQQIKQELYIFLMQKAEETAISKTSNISVAKVIDPPKSEVSPISPKKTIFYALAILSGIVFPTALIFLINILNTTISTKMDISSQTDVPVIGEISHNDSSDNLIVANQSRSAISEQFRALRTNLSFFLKNKDEKVILLTSSMSGEGKSFTAINLGNILALAGKKVLLMELDLRKPGLSAKLGLDGGVGFSNYTITPNMEVGDIIKPLTINKNMFIISSGPLPPNPAETLISERMPKLIEELKEEFDYIIMDAPPIGIIADAQLLTPYASLVLYLVRQKVTRIDQLHLAQDLYKSGKMKNMGIVVNDIISKYYGYGYGYGNYGESVNEKWYKKIFKNS
ncbi:polysaccharide biosynthesis tyrosine autokinase [Pedobacter frigidisoli]|uniref:GumC family protein n=1 Tax=Pedobacter frigidisoli TaxID=2530455 RepID=UPI0029306420|nr:polysaccharide biosynthesis tyrosine autokinase [Pedobacter frigidisoli]